MRLRRILKAKLILVADDHINYYTESPKSPKFAYVDKEELKTLLIKAIRADAPVDLLIENIEKGKKFDYVVEVKEISPKHQNKE